MLNWTALYMRPDASFGSTRGKELVVGDASFFNDPYKETIQIPTHIIGQTCRAPDLLPGLLP